MSEYNIDVNGKRFELNDEFKESLERRAEIEYEDNAEFSCWWMVATESGDWLSRDDHEAGDPVLVIDTTGPMVPWDRIDQLEMRMDPRSGPESSRDSQPADVSDEPDETDAGNGMAEMKPPEDEPPEPGPRDVNFGRTHFGLTPHRFEEVPSPGGDDPDKIPAKPERLDEPSMVMWVPRHPDVDVTWGAGEAMMPMSSRVEWNVQEKADQPRPSKDKRNSHDAFESLCNIHNCEKIGEYTPSNDIPKEVSGQVERKGEEAYEEGKYGGDNWSV
jgi:hypothetical protein